MKAWSFRESGIAVGSMVGPYRLGEPIGAGAMGVVFEAERDGEWVAVKVLRQKWLGDHTVVRRFHDEAIAGTLVRHRNVAGVYEYGETDDGLPFVAMELVRGQPLRLLVERDGPLYPRRAAAMAMQVLAGLDAMHGSGVVHGDVKSDNVLIATLDDGTDVAKLIDFGLAHIQGGRRAEPIAPDLVAGTPDYMAPEVITGRGLFPASDLYALGVVLYEALTGTTPFAGGTAAEILERHLEAEVVPPSLRAPGRAIPPVLDQMVMRALEKDRRERFASAMAFATALARAMRSMGEARPRDLEWSGLSSCDRPTLRWVRGDESKAASGRRRPAIETPGP